MAVLEAGVSISCVASFAGGQGVDFGGCAARTAQDGQESSRRDGPHHAAAKLCHIPLPRIERRTTVHAASRPQVPARLSIYIADSSCASSAIVCREHRPSADRRGGAGVNDGDSRRCA